MALDESIIRLLKKNASTITKAEEAILKGLPGYEKKIFKAVKDHLSKFNKTGGKFDFDETNVNLVNEVDQIMIDTLQGSTYPDQVSKYLQNFDTVTELNSQIHSKLNGIDPDELRDLVDPAKQQFAEETLNGLTGAGMDAEFVDPVRQELFKNIVAGANSTEVEQALRNMIEGDAARLGGLERYVGQVTRDALNQYDGTVNARIANEFGLDAFQYVGSLIDDSRAQCRKWVSMEVLLKEDLPTLISSAFSNGQGMIPGTNSDNFAVYRGGYNCRHQAIPFKMTKREKDRLKKDQEEEEDQTQELQIAEIEESIATNEERKKISGKKVKKQTKTKLNDEQYISTRKKQVNQNFLDQLSDTNGAIEIANEFKTNVSLRIPVEATQTGTAKFLQKTGRQDLTINEVGVYDSQRIQGFVRVNNQVMTVKMNAKDELIFVKAEPITGSKNPFYPTDNEVQRYYLETTSSAPDFYFRSPTYVAKKPKETARSGRPILLKKRGTWKFEGVSEMLNKLTGSKENVTSILTHESAHLIQNKFDPYVTIPGKGRIREKLVDLMKERNIKVTDSLTWYGETNPSELFAESFAAYVHANREFKKSNRKLFDFMEELLFDVYKIDKKSIKIAK